MKEKPSASLPTRFGDFRITAVSNEIVVLAKGEVKTAEPVLVRIHSGCITGDIFGSLKCDCREQLEESMRIINREGKGIIIYLREHEGRGIGFYNKIKTYKLQENGYDTVEANHQIGFSGDLRDYKDAVGILNELRIKKIKLITNNPQKIKEIEEGGIKVVERVPVKSTVNEYNKKYLETKKEKLGHDIKLQ
ncbi:GTP cyclohydrolase II [Candidatus Micrarchaeota archaeon]|nr:GTP cyclohydrolase II [Candidatus Micrarchaeota archaeon]